MASILIDKLLQAAVKQGASDIHIVTGQPPVFRLHGRMRKLETKVLEPDDSMLESAFAQACYSLESTLATLLLEQETREPARSAGQWLQGFHLVGEQDRPRDEEVCRLLERHELIEDVKASRWKLRVPLMQRYLQRRR